MALLSDKKKGFFGKLSERITDAIFMHPKIDEDMMDEIEEILITSDIGMETTINIMEDLRKYVKENHLTEAGELRWNCRNNQQAYGQRREKFSFKGLSACYYDDWNKWWRKDYNHCQAWK